MLNTVALVGRLERDPYVKFDNDSGQAKCRATLRLEESGSTGMLYKTYVPLEAFGRTAEGLGEQHAGALVAVTGKIVWQKYTAKDGTEKSSLAVLVNRYTVLQAAALTGTAAEV